MESMDPNAMVRALDKLMDYTASGIGAVAGPMLATWRARREAAALRIAAQGQADSLRIIATAQAEVRDIMGLDRSGVRGDIDIAEKVRQRIEFQEEKRHHNIGSAVRQAAEILGDKDVPDQEPDHDWTARFFAEVQDVSSEDMRTIWARILAGEVEKPGSTSLHTLAVLRNMDRRVATIFEAFCSICIYTTTNGTDVLSAGVIHPIHRRFEVIGLGNYKDHNLHLKLLNEYGLITADYYDSLGYYPLVPTYSGPLKYPQQPWIFLEFQGRHWVLQPVESEATERDVELSGAVMTLAGRELSRAVKHETDWECIQGLVDFFEKGGLIMSEVSVLQNT